MVMLPDRKHYVRVILGVASVYADQLLEKRRNRCAFVIRFTRVEVVSLEFLINNLGFAPHRDE